VVPSVAGWRLSGLPKGLEPDQLHSQKPNQPTLSQAATNHQTAFSPGSKPSDYADLTSPLTPTTSEFHNNIDIIRRSA
jgi:hypothetical protein